MRRRLSLILTLAAWLLATGSHWDVVQTFGWARMFATFSQSMSFTEAVKKTFAPDAMCGVCHVVADAKQAQAAADAPAPGAGKMPAKLFLACAPAALVLVSPAPLGAGLTSVVPALASADRPAPPLPPPRGLA